MCNLSTWDGESVLFKGPWVTFLGKTGMKRVETGEDLGRRASHLGDEVGES
jgi:hypothetical protein